MYNPYSMEYTSVHNKKHNKYKFLKIRYPNRSKLRVSVNFLNGICVITLMGFDHRKRGGIISSYARNTTDLWSEVTHSVINVLDTLNLNPLRDYSIVAFLLRFMNFYT